MKITITKISKIKRSAFGAFEYMHFFQYDGGYKYTVYMTDECGWKLIEALRLSNEVKFAVKNE